MKKILCFLFLMMVCFSVSAAQLQIANILDPSFKTDASGYGRWIKQVGGLKNIIVEATSGSIPSSYKLEVYFKYHADTIITPAYSDWDNGTKLVIDKVGRVQLFENTNDVYYSVRVITSGGSPVANTAISNLYVTIK